MEWYAFEEDFNTQKLVRINVLSNFDKKEIKKRLDKGEELYDIIKKDLHYYYWSKAEHEVLVTGLHHREGDPIHKIDIWYQLEPNINRIVEYVEKQLERK